jgi:hypothetical protein
MIGTARTWGSSCVLFGALLCLAATSGCAIVNAQSAARLSSQALLTTRSLIQTLEDTRASLDVYVDGQALSAPLLNQEPPSKQTLCSIQSAQRSLRLRVRLLTKLGVGYDRFADLANQGSDDLAIFDNVIGELDPSDYPTDPPLVADCPPEPDLKPPDPGELTKNTSPGVLMGVSRSRSLRYASEKLRGLLTKIVGLLEHELPIYTSLQQEALRSRRSLAKALLQKYGTVSPGELLSPQLQDLGLRWDELQFQQQQASWPKEKRDALQAAISAAIDRRATYLLGSQGVALAQQLSLLRALVRLHVSLERGQPLDWRQIAAPVVPILQSIHLQGGCPR